MDPGSILRQAYFAFALVSSVLVRHRAAPFLLTHRGQEPFEGLGWKAIRVHLDQRLLK